MEQIKIIVDEKGHTHLWIDGKKQTHVVKIKLETRTEVGQYPILQVERAIFPIEKNIDSDLGKFLKNLTGRE